MKNFNVEWLGERALDDAHLGSIPFVSSYHRVGSPIRPINIILKQGDRKRMGKRFMALDDVMVVVAIIICCMNCVRSETQKNKYILG